MTQQLDRRTHTFTGADGTTLAYHRVGEGPPLLCMPGGPGRASSYLEDLAGLAESFELVQLDAPGTGDSARPREERGYGFPTLAEHLAALRHDLELDRVRLLGHSAGAVVAELYAVTHPDEVEAVVLVTPAGWPHDVTRADVEQIKASRREEPWYAHSTEVLDQPEDTVPQRERTLAFRPFMYGAWDERQQAHAAGADDEQDEMAEHLYWQPADLDEAVVRARAKELAVPVLVVAGAVDAVTGVASAEAVADGLPTARLEVIGGAGHFPWVDRPGEFRRILEEFLR